MGQKAKPERYEGRWGKMFPLYSVRTPRNWSVTLLALLACLTIGVSGLAGSTTTTVDSSPNPSVYGQTITFTVTVSGVQTPSGTVTLKDGSTTLGTKDLATEGTATVTFTSSDLGAGTHTIMAEYSGYSDYGYDPSTSDPVYQTVNKASTEVTVEADVNPSVTGQEVTFTATVAAVFPGAGTPTGTVIFYVNNVAISSGISLDSNGKASCTYTFDAAGSYSITVEYNGDDNYTSSDNKASPYSQAVNPADTSVTVDSSQDPSVTGQPVTFTATVEASGDGSGTPTGTVTFYKGDTTTGTPICTDVPLNNAGKASCTTALNAADADASNHIDVSVEYSGDSNFNSSTGTYQQTVNPADTSVTLSSSNNPANVGDPIIFTATVSVDSPGAGTPTGTVTFTVNDKDGTQVATSTENLDNSGAATYDISTLDASGSPYAVTAEYNGDSNFNASTSSSLTQLVKTDSTTTVSLTSPSGTPVTGESVTFTATVSASGVTPTGTVTFTVTDNNGAQVATSTESLSGGSATFTTTALKAEGSQYTVEADYNGDDRTNPSSGSLTQTVDKADTVTTITSDTPDPSVLGQPYLVEGTVAASSPGSGIPTGTVTVSDGQGNTCTANVDPATGEWNCTINATSATTTAGVATLTATYTGDNNFNGSSNTESHTYTNPGTRTEVMGADTPLIVNNTATYRVEVVDTSGSTIPQGTVDISVSPSGVGTLSATTVNLDAAGTCTFTYTPTDGDTTPHVITVTYSSTNSLASSIGTFVQEVVKRAADITMKIDPATAYILQPVTITVHVEDDTTEGTPSTPTGTVTFDDGGVGGTFEGNAAPYTTSLSDGNCTVTYTPPPGSQGTVTITATYSGSAIHSGKSTSEQLKVNLRPTATTVKCVNSNGDAGVILVNEQGECTVTVKDVTGDGNETSPAGTLKITNSLAPSDVTMTETQALASNGSDSSQAKYTYLRTGLDEDGDRDTIGAEYDPNDGIHAKSAGGYVQAIQRRPTKTELNCDATSDGYSCTVEVKDEDNPGTASPPVGKIVDLSDNSDVVGGSSSNIFNVGGCGMACSSGSFSRDTDAIKANATVEYEPENDRVHLKSTGSQDIDRSNYVKPDPGHNGSYNITAAIKAMNESCLAADTAALALDAVELAVDDEPDPVVGVAEGIGVAAVEGVTIPTSDIQATIIGGSRLALQGYSLAACTDLDGDGIPGVIEALMGTSDQDFDSDDDGMDDLGEIYNAGGWYGGNPKACPDPTNADSDGDGLSDGGEYSNYDTDFCNPDTDGDALTDGQEVDTWNRANDWDHADPNAADTDHDGLPDDIEFAPGQLLTSQPANHFTFSSYVNNPDTDGDGIIDGTEDSNHNGKWDYTSIGGTGNGAASIGNGETNPCMADTDGDGLTDGEEAEQLGAGTIHVITPYGTDTNPALDTDSDDDGLSDYEEVNVTHTDPLNYDTDGDGIWDVNEFIAIGGSWPHRQFQEISDPLDPDTDDDGLPDNIEYNGTGLGIGHGLGGSDDTVCPYVNDDDSDDDGLQDGHEDANHDGTIDNSIGDTGTQGSGETSFCIADTDGDGLSDGQEEGLFGQGAVTAHTPSGDVTTIPALDKDSDDDGLSDYEEVNVTHTDPLNWDTDGDSLSDLNELIATGGIYPQRSFKQVSDPLDPDTDDDGLVDSVEYNGTGMGTGHSLGGSEDLACPFVNDADSDHDGLQDGVEDANHDGTWGVNGSGVTIGSFDSQAAPASDGYYETDLCNPDTDGDGLTDGEEVAQLGGGPISGRPADWPDKQPSPGFNTITPEGESTVLPTADYSGTGPLYTFNPQPGPALSPTVPALDVDSDNDGLSDYEELNTTGTDPLDADSDNDTIMDADELIATGGTAGAHPQRTFDQVSDPLDINTDDDYLPDPVEGSCGNPVYTGTGLSGLAGALGGNRDTLCPYVNNADSDDDGVKDGAVIPITHEGPNGFTYSYVFIEGFPDVAAANVAAPGTVRTVVTPATGEQDDDAICNVCDPDSDGDGLTDGEEVGLGTDPQDWDTDDDGRNDWSEVTGGGPIPTDPFDPDTDDDGLLDSAEVFGSNPTNPVVADTDGDGLCDGGAGTPYMVSGHQTVTVNPICKACSTPGNAPCAVMDRSGSASGIGDHPNPKGLGEDENGNGAWDTGETDPNQYDTDGDAEGDGIEKLGFSTSRQDMIPSEDLFGRPIKVVYPSVGCMDPLNPDTDGDGLSDGYEDRNHDGNFDFLPSEFDHADPLPGPPIPYPTETNPCDPDTDHDGLSDYAERYQPNPNSAYPFNPTNPLDHDTDNDYILDGPEVNYQCTEITYAELDNDGDALIDEDPPDGLDNDGDGLIDEDGPDFTVRHVDVLDPTNRDSDSDGFIDGLDPDPCNSELIPILQPVKGAPVDSDGDGFSDDDERIAGTHPNDPNDHPTSYCRIDLDFDQQIDDRLWLEPASCCKPANSVAIDINSDVLVDARVQIVAPRDVEKGDFDGDGEKDDYRYVIEYSLSNYRVVQPHVVLTIDDYNADLVIDHAEVTRK